VTDGETPAGNKECKTEFSGRHRAATDGPLDTKGCSTSVKVTGRRTKKINTSHLTPNLSRAEKESIVSG